MDTRFMLDAIALAQKAADENEVPVGAVVVKNGVVIGKGYNTCNADNSVFSHAECIAIKDAGNTIGDWRLDGCELYVTLEPCVMCTGAIINSRISEVVFGAYDKTAGCIESKAELCKLNLAPSPKIYGGVKQAECERLITGFFERVRKEKT